MGAEHLALGGCYCFHFALGHRAHPQEEKNLSTVRREN
jgi:hypothetical protein